MSSTQLTIPQVRSRRVRAARATPDALWEPADRFVTAVLVTLGVVLIAVAWIGASDTTDWDTQLGWTALSMVGVVVVCVGVGVWLFRGFARVRSQALFVRRELAARLAAAATTGDDNPSGWTRVTVAGMSHHHSPDCLLVRGKAAVAATDDLPPCGVCA